MQVRKLYLILSLLSLAFSLWQCLPSKTLSLRAYNPPPERPAAFDRLASARRPGSPCGQSENYIPDTNHLDHYFVKDLRVNIHWMNAADSSQNMNGARAVAFAKGLVKAANYDVEQNHAMYLPHQNRTPTLPVGYRYVLTGDPADPADDGIYFHYDDDLYYYVHQGKTANLGDRTQMRTYGVQADTVLNIFLMPHHPDSVASPTYNAWGVGVALGNHFKMAAQWVKEGKDDYWNHRGNFNHETGHLLGLAHAWRRDGCDDTPEHRQECWGRGQRPGCDTLTSNNVMDYAAKQHAWSPCQIGKIQYTLARPERRLRHMLTPKWCTRDPARDIVIRDSVFWDSQKDLEGNLRIENGGYLRVACRLSIPSGGRITVAPRGTLDIQGTQLHNACDLSWEGIFVEEAGGQSGQVLWAEGRLDNVQE